MERTAIVKPGEAPLPEASTLPAGTTVLSLSGTDRRDLRRGVALWGLAFATVGLGIGYWLGRRSGVRG